MTASLRQRRARRAHYKAICRELALREYGPDARVEYSPTLPQPTRCVLFVGSKVRLVRATWHGLWMAMLHEKFGTDRSGPMDAFRRSLRA